MLTERILLDISLQRDLFSPGGSCFRPAAGVAAKNARRLFAWARREGVRAISTMLRVRAGKIGPLATVPHCVDGSNGEKRISGALLARHIDLGMRNITDLPRRLLDDYRQALFEMRFTDIFKHDRIERLLTELDAGTFVVCGAGAAQGIVQAVLGLRARDFRVILVTDAILDLDDPAAEYAWQRMLAKGAVPLTTDQVLALPRPVRKRTRTVGAGCAGWRDGALTR